MTTEKSSQSPPSANSDQIEVKATPQEVARAIQGLESGKELTQHQHEVLEGVLQSVARKEPEMLAQVAFKQEFFSGPLPQAKELNAYDEETRRIVVNMAVEDQRHTHAMQRRGLTGAIWKDRTAQICAFAIALGGFGAAAYIAKFSAAAAAVIGSFDILAIVCAFIAPRVLEQIVVSRAAKQKQPSASKKPPAKKR